MTSVAPAPAATRVRTLREARAVFLRHASPWYLALLALTALVLQLVSGQWRWAQLAVAAAVVAAQPFVEWLIHVYVLHARPRRVGRFTLDSVQARKHRAHHAAPRDLDILFIPLHGHVSGAAILGGLCLLLPDAATRLALVFTVAVSSLVYEWIHFLVHTDYKPRTAAYRRLYTGHRLHHYRNENYWFGVSRRLGDDVLRTNPAKEDVPLSPTCLTLAG